MNHSPKVVNMIWKIRFPKHPVKQKRIVVGVSFQRSLVVHVMEKKVHKSKFNLYLYTDNAQLRLSRMLNRDSNKLTK